MPVTKTANLYKINGGIKFGTKHNDTISEQHKPESQPKRKAQDTAVLGASFINQSALPKTSLAPWFVIHPVSCPITPHYLPQSQSAPGIPSAMRL